EDGRREPNSAARRRRVVHRQPVGVAGLPVVRDDGLPTDALAAERLTDSRAVAVDSAPPREDGLLALRIGLQSGVAALSQVPGVVPLHRIEIRRYALTRRCGRH